MMTIFAQASFIRSQTLVLSSFWTLYLFTPLCIRLTSQVVDYLNPAVDDQIGLRRHLARSDLSHRLSFKLSDQTPIDDFLMTADKYENYRTLSIPELGEEMISYLVLDRVRFPNGNSFFHTHLYFTQ